MGRQKGTWFCVRMRDPESPRGGAGLRQQDPQENRPSFFSHVQICASQMIYGEERFQKLPNLSEQYLWKIQ